MKIGKKEKIKKTAIEFAEWCASYGIAKHGDKWVAGSLWSWGHQKSIYIRRAV